MGGMREEGGREARKGRGWEVSESYNLPANFLKYTSHQHWPHKGLTGAGTLVTCTHGCDHGKELTT